MDPVLIKYIQDVSSSDYDTKYKATQELTSCSQNILFWMNQEASNAQLNQWVQALVRNMRLPNPNIAMATIQLLLQCLDPELEQSSHSLSASSTADTEQVNLDVKKDSLKWPVRAWHLFPSHIIPALLDAMGDQKEKLRTLSTQLLFMAYQKMMEAAFPNDTVLTASQGSGHLQAGISSWDKILKESGFSHKNARVKEQMLIWLCLAVQDIPKFAWKSYINPVVKLLEDSSEVVRENAKETVLLLLRVGPPVVKKDVRREMEQEHIRPQIFSIIFSSSDALLDEKTSEVGGSTGSLKMKRDSSIDSNLGAKSSHSLPNVSSLNTTSKDIIQLLNALDSLYQEKETEHNWNHRDKALKQLQNLIHGCPPDLCQEFAHGIKSSALDYILNSALSLRSTLVITACSTLNEFGIMLGKYLENQFDTIQTLVKVSGSSKKLLASGAAQAAQSILGNAPFHYKTFNLICNGMNEKNQALRIHIVSFIKTTMEGPVMANSTISQQLREEKRQYFFQLGGWDVLEKALRKGIQDANPTVREASRQLFWNLSECWGNEAVKTLLIGLDAKTLKSLQKRLSSGGSRSTNKASSLQEHKIRSKIPSFIKNSRPVSSNSNDDIIIYASKSSPTQSGTSVSESAENSVSEDRTNSPQTVESDQSRSSTPNTFAPAIATGTSEGEEKAHIQELVDAVGNIEPMAVEEEESLPTNKKSEETELAVMMENDMKDLDIGDSPSYMSPLVMSRSESQEVFSQEISTIPKSYEEKPEQVQEMDICHVEPGNVIPDSLPEPQIVANQMEQPRKIVAPRSTKERHSIAGSPSFENHVASSNECERKEARSKPVETLEDAVTLVKAMVIRVSRGTFEDSTLRKIVKLSHKYSLSNLNQDKSKCNSEELQMIWGENGERCHVLLDKFVDALRTMELDMNKKKGILIAIKNILQHQGFFVEKIEEMVDCLLKVEFSPMNEVQEMLQDIFSLALVQHPESCTMALLKYIQSQFAEAVEALLQPNVKLNALLYLLLRQLFDLQSPSELSELLENRALHNSLVLGFVNEDLGVRKAVVDAMIPLFITLGPGLFQYFKQDLSQQQLRLIVMYAEKYKREHGR